ncbi:MAG: hypothetical protein Q7R99_04195 [bacterium]|nr:hypothetical protein [bacterium]
MKKNKLVVLLVLVAVILAGVAGIFYYKSKIGGEKSEAPKLFSKGDYVVEDRADGKYIVVNKVGLTAKVPTDWRVEFEGNDLPDGTSEYWVNLLSQDAEKKGSFLMKGCGITITLGYEENNNKDLNEQILAIQNNDQDNNLFRAGYQYEILSVGKNRGIKWTGEKNDTFGKNVGLDIPVGSVQTIGFSSIFPVKNEVTCENTWGDFLKTIDLK